MYADDVKLCLQYKDISRHLDLESDLERFQIIMIIIWLKWLQA